VQVLFSGGAVAMVVVCCRGHALALGVLGGLALGSVIGIGAGALAAALLVAGILMVRRRRKDPPAPWLPYLSAPATPASCLLRGMNPASRDRRPALAAIRRRCRALDQRASAQRSPQRRIFASGRNAASANQNC